MVKIFWPYSFILTALFIISFYTLSYTLDVYNSKPVFYTAFSILCLAFIQLVINLIYTISCIKKGPLESLILGVFEIGFLTLGILYMWNFLFLDC